MARQLKVYSWIYYRHELPARPNGNKQSREVVAAHSVAEVLRLAGITRSEYNWNGGPHASPFATKLALSEPGTVFYTSLDDRDDSGWRKL